MGGRVDRVAGLIALVTDAVAVVAVTVRASDIRS